LPIGDDVAGSPAEVDRNSAHEQTLCPPCKEFRLHGVKGLLGLWGRVASIRPDSLRGALLLQRLTPTARSRIGAADFMFFA
jgi:hypothetical protein